MFVDRTLYPCCENPLSLADAVAEEFVWVAEESDDPEWFLQEIPRLKTTYEFYCLACDIGFLERDVRSLCLQKLLGKKGLVRGTGKTDIALGLAQN